MTLPNRMTPFGMAEADPARGMFMGNRGCLVDRHGRHARPWRGERWITCLLEFKERSRGPLMAPGRYTELFFLDEATALAAGHRPCAECRRGDLADFRAAWLEVHPEDAGPLTVLDGRLHAERTAPARRIAAARSLPEGVMVALDRAAWLVVDGGLRAWSHGGYGERRALPDGAVEVLTPPSSVAVLEQRWHPVLHPSAREPAGRLPAGR
jgi:hypothetical protein